MPKKATPEQQRKRHLWHRYGLKPGTYEEMLIAQSNKCYTCGKEGGDRKGTRLCIDHNHKTNIVRKLLCNRCNYIAGAIEDVKFKSVMKYLNEHA